jgi:hypothetical protein
MSLSCENPVAWQGAGRILAGTLLIVALSAAATVPLNGGPVTQATTPDNSAATPKTLIISSPGTYEIVKMVDAKVDVSVIKAYVQNSTTAYNPSASDLIALKNHGVPDEVLTAMLEHGAQVRSQIAQMLHKQAAAAPAYTASAEAPTYTAPAASYPADYGNYAATYPDYSYGYPYGYSYPYNYWWYNYGYGWPYYSYYWPFYGGYFCNFCHHFHGHGDFHHDGHSHWGGWPGHVTPHSTTTFAAHSNVRTTGAFSPVGTMHSRPTGMAMNRSSFAPMGGGARAPSFAAHMGGFHGGGGGGGHAAGGHAGGGGGRR